jgi:hypothetical protein
MYHKLNLFFEKKPFLSFILLAGLLACLEGAFSFCSKIHCAGFTDAEFDSWFPYAQGKTVYFKSGNNDIDSLYNLSVFKTAASTTSGGFGGGKCDAPLATIQSVYVDSATLFFMLSYNTFGGSGSNNILNLNVNQFLVTGINITDSGIVISPTLNPVQSSFYSSLTIEGNNYNNVQVIQTDTTGLAANSVYKIWLAKNIGLLAYQEYPSLAIWLKQ